jgi:hypothetical protein
MIPNNEPTTFYGPPYRCGDCGSRILDETGVRRFASLPNVRETNELERQGLYAGKGNPLPWFGPAFQCQRCVEKWRASAERTNRWLDTRD